MPQSLGYQGGLFVVGSGKTTTLIARISWLVDQGADPARITALTFNRRAADDLLERLTTIRALMAEMWASTSGPTYGSCACRSQPPGLPDDQPRGRPERRRSREFNTFHTPYARA